MQIFIILLIVLITEHGSQNMNKERCPVGEAVQFDVQDDVFCDNPDAVKFHSQFDYKVHCCLKTSFRPCYPNMLSRFVLRRTGKQIIYTTQNYKKKYIENEDTREFVFEKTVEYGTRYLCPYPLMYLMSKMMVPTVRFKQYLKAFDKKYLPKRYPFEHLKVCQTNNECGFALFCGDVINRSEHDKYSALCSNNKAKCKVHNDCMAGAKCEEDVEGSPYWDEEYRFCFEKPEITARYSSKQQYALRPSEKDFPLCESDHECGNYTDLSGVCNRDLGGSPNENMRWSRYVPDGGSNNTGKLKIYPGICMQAIPISYTFSHINESNPNDQYIAIGGKTNFREHLKTCDKNADCDQGQYCGDIISLNEEFEFHTERRFCFIVPAVVYPPTSDNKYTVLPEKRNIVPCNTDIDCILGSALNSFCHNSTGLKYVGIAWDTGKTLFNGLCTDGDSYVKQCKLGGELIRSRKCGNFKMHTFAECNGGDQGDAWCDESIDRCCRDPAIGLCPDGQTRLFNEPQCSGYDEAKPASGTCTAQMGAICKFGHCCPNVTIGSYGNFNRGKYSYITNLHCQPGVRPLKYLAGYCEPESGKVVIFGKLTRLKEILTRWPEDSPRLCERDSDCSEDGDTICIFKMDPYCQDSRQSCEENSDCPGEFGICMRHYEGFCHYNPLRHIPVKFPVQYEYVWILIVIVGLGVIMIIGVVVVVKWSSKRDLKNAQAPMSPVQSPNG